MPGVDDDRAVRQALDRDLAEEPDGLEDLDDLDLDVDDEDDGVAEWLLGLIVTLVGGAVIGIVGGDGAGEKLALGAAAVVWLLAVWALRRALTRWTRGAGGSPGVELAAFLVEVALMTALFAAGLMALGEGDLGDVMPEAPALGVVWALLEAWDRRSERRDLDDQD